MCPLVESENARRHLWFEEAKRVFSQLLPRLRGERHEDRPKAGYAREVEINILDHPESFNVGFSL